jgi:hypothetical protein
MCAGSAISSKFRPSYSNNYGYGSAGNDSPFANEERQWYIDQGFGDPNEVVGKRGPSGGYTTGRTYNRPTPGTPGYYKGVSPEARYLYRQSLAPKPAPAPAPAAPTAALAVPTATTRWAGKALTINPVSM